MRGTRCGPAATTPGNRSNRASNSRRESVEDPFRCTTRFENDDRIEENCNTVISRGKFNYARNRRALKQLKQSQHFVQRLFRRILKLVAHSHDQRGISERNNVHQVILSCRAKRNISVSYLSSWIGRKVIRDSSLRSNDNATAYEQ